VEEGEEIEAGGCRKSGNSGRRADVDVGSSARKGEDECMGEEEVETGGVSKVGK
jgi:hypothetical protein